MLLRVRTKNKSTKHNFICITTRRTAARRQKIRPSLGRFEIHFHRFIGSNGSSLEARSGRPFAVLGTALPLPMVSDPHRGAPSRTGAPSRAVAPSRARAPRQTGGSASTWDARRHRRSRPICRPPDHPPHRQRGKCPTRRHSPRPHRRAPRRRGRSSAKLRGDQGAARAAASSWARLRPI